MSGAFTDYRENFAVGSSDGLKADQHLCSGKPKLKAKNLFPACSLKPAERNIMAKSWKGIFATETGKDTV